MELIIVCYSYASHFKLHRSLIFVILSSYCSFCNERIRPSFGDWWICPHMPIIRPHATRFHERHISSVTFTSAHLYGNVYIPVGVACTLANLSDFGLLGSKVHKNGRLFSVKPMNRSSKFDAASFILGGGICNRTNKQTNTSKQ